MGQLPYGAQTDSATSQSWSCEVLSDSRDHLTRKLRLSLVDSCNLQCFFCHNEGQGPVRRVAETSLSVHEISLIIRAAVKAGIREVKLTGGEPLIYRSNGHGIVDVVQAISDLRSECHFGLSATTNGLLLPKLGRRLRLAGLDRVTISLHTLDDTRFARLISFGNSRVKPQSIIEAIGAAANVGLSPVKVNMVLFHSSSQAEGNLGEIGDVVALCRSYGVSQLRLYTLLRHPSFPDHREWYQYWNRDLLKATGLAVLRDDQSAVAFAEKALCVLAAYRSVVYPRPHLILTSGDFQLAIEALESGQFDQAGLPDEGPYALRVSADGKLRGLINGQGTEVDLAQMIRNGATVRELQSVFHTARRHALPAG